MTNAIASAAAFFRTSVARHGGYVYYYSPDLTRRLGEGEASADQIWVQPPGTPTVGMAYVAAYEATGREEYRDAATEAAEALLYGQLQSGGWTNCVDFDPKGSRVAQYRNGRGRGKDNSTLDDGITQSALRLLMRVDRLHAFRNQRIHDGTMVGLEALLAAQFSNGAFPQVWTGPVEHHQRKTSSFPSYDWRTEGRIKNYWDMYTLNDGLAGTVSRTLADAYHIYNDKRYDAALRRLGDFLIDAQLPAPQPAWGQQYSYEMHPIWARKFEPPAVSGGESQDVLETLIFLFEQTNDRKYLQPLESAIAYLRRSLLTDGRLARFYELQTNRPLYMTRRGDVYELTYRDDDLPSHYGWKIDSRLDAIEAAFKTSTNRTNSQRPDSSRPKRRTPVELEPLVRESIKVLDKQGRWLSTFGGEPLSGQPKFQQGDLYISSDVFSQRIQLLSEYLMATSASDGAAAP